MSQRISRLRWFRRLIGLIASAAGVAAGSRGKASTMTALSGTARTGHPDYVRVHDRSGREIHVCL